MKYAVCALILVVSAAVPLVFAGPPATTFLTPAFYASKATEPVRLQFSTADGKVQAWGDEAARVFWRGPSTQENRHEVAPARAGDAVVAVTPVEAGVTVIGVDCQPVAFRMSGAELRNFLTRNVAAEAVKEGDRPEDDAQLEIRYVSSSKTLVRVGATDSAPAGVAASKTGQPVELQPLMDPTAATVGSDLALRLHLQGDKKSGAKVQATAPGGSVTSFITDPVGSGHFRITEPGIWRVEAHHAAPDRDGQWVIYSATLTFEVTARGGAR